MLVCFDLSDHKSIANTERLADMVLEHNKNMLIVIVGCKCDRPNSTSIAGFMRLKSKYVKNTVTCVKTSSLNKVNLEKLQDILNKIVYSIYERCKIEKDVPIEKNHSNKSSSCSFMYISSLFIFSWNLKTCSIESSYFQSTLS